MKLLSVLEATTGHFTKHGVPSPRLQAELLLAHALSLPRLGLYLQFERELNATELESLRHLVRRRAAREPLQHVTGSSGFCGLTLKCTPAALIPRPETEILVEHAARIMGELQPGLVIDVGTGTGAIPLALARKQPAFRYFGVDLSGEALALAAENTSASSSAPPAGTSVTWKKGDLLEGITETAVLITANLPYLTSAEIESAEPEVRHDPLMALAGGAEGLDLIRRLIPQTFRLAPALLLECGPEQAPKVAALAREAGFPQVAVHPDLTSRPRVVEARRS
ncbi:MAG: peptide chain release factor N(5)-glutamine methyltransferase [Verrucomicrobia bacterium]|nr:peptide chain release factor N(5)-glutamine methyltransferase [Verrucomicrobiota bacterium]